LAITCFLLAGAKVILACRNLDSGQRAAEEIRKKTDNPNVTAMYLDLSSKASIVTFSDEVKSSV
jgi:NAD(P)-dependent dehydrogenase (short-subunit alcohol dehydrogenase family)